MNKDVSVLACDDSEGCADFLAERAKEFGVDGLMVGRGIFHNPWFFNPKVYPEKISPKERIQLLWKHTQLFTEFWGEKKNFDTLKRFYKVRN